MTNENNENFEQQMMMEEALKSFDKVSRGNVVTGIIAKVTPEEIFVDIGYKSEGRIPYKEFEEMGLIPVEGREIQSLITNIDDNKGFVNLSYVEAIKKNIWENIIKAHDENSVIKGKITSKLKGGFQVTIEKSIECFLPFSQLGQVNGEPVGQVIDFEVIEIRKKNKDIVLSHKSIQDNFKTVRFAEIAENKKEGDLIKGKISNITDFGAFIDFGGIEGLLHITDISWGRINNIEDVLSAGQELELIILKLDEKKTKISVGLKQKSPEPWKVIQDNYKIGDVVNGKIMNITDYGAFVELEPGLEGLLHVSDISWKKTGNPADILKTGQNIKVKILDINIEKKKISLGIKQLTNDPWNTINELFSIDTILEVKIKNLQNSGIIVELTPEVEGFVHIGDISWSERVSHPSEYFNEEQIIKVKVLEIDKEKRNIRLGVKQLEPDPWTIVKDNYSEGQIVNGKIMRMTNFGVFVKLDNGLEGLLHISDLSWTKRINHPKDMLKEKDEIKVKILSINPAEKRISLGLKQVEGDPWENIEEKYAVNTTVEGKVTNIRQFGAFVELEPGIEGLLHINDLSWTNRTNNVNEYVKSGQEIKVRILNIDTDKRQLALGLKQLEENPFEKYTEGLLVTGVVEEFLKSGVIISLEKGITGFVHKSEISEDYYQSAEDVLKKSDKVEVRVIENNSNDRKLKLSIKQAQYGKIANEFIMTEENDSGGVSVGDKLKKALNSKK
ncbi:MAG: S1 RNA-binding domain-containing protein [Candidatus Muirbacterium halophilum]|nr:S1 RNA-binding domain-containing protein [Candidatus Muirbacterium halophilum]MCK9475793.1 S1 RNA-binding domain-containing protein [Candidatus Muirbacterium halophilum]